MLQTIERPSLVVTRPELPRKTPSLWLGYILDVLLTLAFAAGAGAGARWLQSKMDVRLDNHRTGDEVYFNADVPRVFSHMTDRKSDHFRIKVHPLFLIIAYPPTAALQHFAHLKPHVAVRTVIASAAALWTVMIFGILRLSGSRRPDAILFTLLALSSAAAIMWFAVPETYTFGGVTLMIPLMLLAIARRHKPAFWMFVAASAASFSVTVTNLMTGILASAFGLSKSRAFRATVYAYFTVVTIWGFQQAFFRDTPFFFDWAVERHVMLRKEWGGPTHNLRSALFSGFVIPEVKAVGLPANPATKEPGRPDYKILTVQLSQVGSGSPWGIPVAAGWALLILTGMIGLIISKEHPAFRAAIGLALFGQLVLHTIYGEEAFLYSLHYLPLFVFVAAYAARTKLRPYVLGLTVILIAGAALNNLRQFNRMATILHNHCDQHQHDPEPGA